MRRKDLAANRGQAHDVTLVSPERKYIARCSVIQSNRRSQCSGGLIAHDPWDWTTATLRPLTAERGTLLDTNVAVG